MMLLPILSTVLSSIILFMSMLVAVVKKKDCDATTSTILTFVIITQIVSMITIWLLYAKS